MSNDKLSGLVYDQLKRNIIEGGFAPGQKLAEDTLSRDYGASRTPVREALLRLERDGLVVSAPHVGVTVREFSRQEISDMFGVRIVLEGLSARSAAERGVSAQDIAYLRELESAIASAHKNRDIAEADSLETMLHGRITELGGNIFAVMFLQNLQAIHACFLNRANRSRISGRYAVPYEQITYKHEPIIFAIELGNGEQAEWAARLHVEESRRYYLNYCCDLQDGA